MAQQHQFTHYCDRCEYLGQVPGIDFYVCRPADRALGTMLHRYGDEDSHYSSFPIGYVPDYGPSDAASFHGRRTVALCKIANAMLDERNLKIEEAS